MKFKDFEIRPTCFLDGYTDPKKWDVVKWYKTDKPVKVIDVKTGKKKDARYFLLFCCANLVE